MATASADIDAWLTLRLVPDIGRMRFHRLIEAFGPPEVALGLPEATLVRVPGMDKTAAGNVVRHAELVDLAREKELLEKHGARVIALHDPVYPINLRHSCLPPPLLYVRGTLEPEDRFAIAVVGSRVSSSYGRMAAEGVVRDLVGAGVAILSGLAVGIDSAAHRAALREGGRPLAVVANGLARCYPAENRPLMEEIAGQGAVISEYPMDESPAKMNFPERNRILAAMSLGVVVVEAPKRSGALITADMALEENRALYAIPSDITRRTAEGSNGLIRSGAARLITSGRDILEDLHGQLRGLLRESADATPIQTIQAQALSEEERKVFDCIAENPVTLDELLVRLEGDGLGIGRLSTVLLGLEMKKVVRQLPGKVFAAAR